MVPAAGVTYADVHALWKGCLLMYGTQGLGERTNFQHENLRETLMKLTVIWADNTQNLRVVQEVVQVLTIILSMTFKCSMDGEQDIDSKAFQLSAWVEVGESQPEQPLLPPAPMRTKLLKVVKDRQIKSIVENEIQLALQCCEDLVGQARVVAPELMKKFVAVSALMDDAQRVLSTM